MFHSRMLLLVIKSPHTLFLIQTPYWGYRLSFGFSNPEDGTDRLYRKVSKKLPPLAM